MQLKFLSSLVEANPQRGAYVQIKNRKRTQAFVWYYLLVIYDNLGRIIRI